MSNKILIITQIFEISQGKIGKNIWQNIAKKDNYIYIKYTNFIMSYNKLQQATTSYVNGENCLKSKDSVFDASKIF